MPQQIAGLYHAGSVGIIMSGWLGAVNYGVIVANEVDAFLMKSPRRPADVGCPSGVNADVEILKVASQDSGETHDRQKSTPPSRTASRSCWSTRSSSRTTRASCAPRRSPAGRTSSPAIIRAIRWCRACCLCEAAMQAGAILLSRQLADVGGNVPVATRMNDVRFKRMVRPGETLRMEVELVERLADAFFLKAKVTVDGNVAVRFEFACTATKAGERPPSGRQLGWHGRYCPYGFGL